MEKWEYCIVRAGWTRGLSSKYIAYITYYTVTGRHGEEIQTDFKTGDGRAIFAIAQAAARLGQDGWGTMSFEIPYDNWRGQAVFKRRVSST